MLSLRLNSSQSSSLLLPASSEPPSRRDYEQPRPRTAPAIEPSNSLVELELHTSSFFDKDPQNRASGIPISTRYLSLNPPAKTTLASRPSYRRPVSLSLDEPNSLSEPSQSQSITSRRSRRTVSPTSVNTDRYHPSPQVGHRYTLAPESTTSTPRFVASYDLDSKPSTDSDARKSVPTSANPIAPSVFTTSGIRFAPAPVRRLHPLASRAASSSSNPARLFNSSTPPNPSANNTHDSIHLAASPTNDHQHHRRSLSSSHDAPPKTRLLDDNNNLISLIIYD